VCWNVHVVPEATASRNQHGLRYDREALFC
jgi:hypothetical protein